MKATVILKRVGASELKTNREGKSDSGPTLFVIGEKNVKKISVILFYFIINLPKRNVI